MKLNRLQWDVLSYAVQVIGDTLEMRIYTMNDRFGNEEPLKYGVNWSAQGTQDAEYALSFAKRLQKAAHTAQLLTDMQITYTYENDGPAMRDKFQDYVKALMTAIEIEMPELAIEILNKLA